MSDENITASNTSDYDLNPELRYFGCKRRVEIKGSCLKQDKITYDHGKIVNINIAYEISKNYNISDNTTLDNCLFGAVSLTKNDGIDNYKYLGYGIGSYKYWFFSNPSGGTGKNLIIFWSRHEFINKDW